MKKIILLISFLCLFTTNVQSQPKLPKEIFNPLEAVEINPELVDLHVPIPKDMRVYNKSGGQCVYCTTETLGNFHKVKGTQGLTKSYTSPSSPSALQDILNKRNVKYKMTIVRDLNFIEEWVTKNKMGVGIRIETGESTKHVITVIHFIRNQEVKIIDNSDPQLRIQTWTWDKFQSKYMNWAFVILPD